MGAFNFITGFSATNKEHFTHVEGRRCELILNIGVGLTGRKFIDCTGGIYIGEFSTIAGLWTQILTHSIDIYRSRQHAASVHVGKYCFVGTGCILLPGSVLPDYSVLGAGSVLNKAFTENGVLYAGSPAMPKKRFDPNTVPWMQRTTLGVK
jgi:acetyltransferase-like isoleucine patch superfamily enzyme